MKLALSIGIFLFIVSSCSISQDPNKIKANEEMKQLDQILNQYADLVSSCSFSEKLDSLRLSMYDLSFNLKKF